MKEEEFLRNEKERSRGLCSFSGNSENQITFSSTQIPYRPMGNSGYGLFLTAKPSKCNKICIKIDTSDTTNLNAAPWCSNDNSMVLMLLSSCKYYEHAFSCIYNTTCVPEEESFRACAPTVHTYSLWKHLRRLILMVFVPFMTKCICIVKHSSPEGEASVCLSEP